MKQRRIINHRRKVRDVSSGVLRALWNRAIQHLPIGDAYRNAVAEELLERDLPGIAMECDAHLCVSVRGVQ